MQLVIEAYVCYCLVVHSFCYEDKRSVFLLVLSLILRLIRLIKFAS